MTACLTSACLAVAGCLLGCGAKKPGAAAARSTVSAAPSWDSDAPFHSPTVLGYRVTRRPLALMYSNGGPASFEVHFRLNQSLPAPRGGKAWIVELGDPQTAADESVEAMNAEGEPEQHC